MKTATVVLAVWCLMAGSYYQQMLVIKELNRSHSEELARYTNLTMRVTAYTASTRECDKDPGVTAINKEAKPGITVAVSRDRAYMLNKSIWIEGLGVWHVTDVMNKRYDNSIDILVKHREIATAWGVQKRRVVQI